jgi:tellurite methyltransferase
LGNHDADCATDKNTEPSRFLVDNLALLPKGLVLDVAMGKGRNAVYLAEQGFDVEGVDISADSIQEALNLAESRKVKIKSRLADLEKNFIFDSTYDLIIVFNYLQCTLFPHIKSSLNKNGMVVYETFTIDQPRFGHPHNPDYLLRYNELLEYFRDFRVLRYQEGIFDNSVAKAAIIAQKV